MVLGTTLSLIGLVAGIGLLTSPLFLPPIYPVIKVVETSALWQHENIHVSKDSKEPVSFYLEKGDSLKMSLIVTATTNLPKVKFDIGYWAEGPQGKILGEEKKVCDSVGSCDFKIGSKQEGMYVIWLDNTFSAVSFKDINVAWKLKSVSTVVEVSPAESTIKNMVGGGLAASGMGGLLVKKRRSRTA